MTAAHLNLLQIDSCVGIMSDDHRGKSKLETKQTGYVQVVVEPQCGCE